MTGFHPGSRFALICLGLLAVGLAVHAVGVARSAAQGATYVALLPLAMQRAPLSDLAYPPTAAPTTQNATGTATATATETMPAATATDAPTATGTATPEVTPTPEPGGRIAGRLLVNGAPAVEGTGLIGPALWLRRCVGQTCTVVTRSGVLGSAGQYVFENVAPLAAGQRYQVTWQNEEVDDLFGDETLLGAWYEAAITSFGSSSDVKVADIELADVALLRPTHGTGFQGLPIHYEWRIRPAEESYRWAIVRGCGLLATRAAAHLTESLGHNGSYDLTRYPPGVEFGNDHLYCWFVRIENAHGYGESFYARMMWFIPVLLQARPGVRGPTFAPR